MFTLNVVIECESRTYVEIKDPVGMTVPYTAIEVPTLCIAVALANLLHKEHMEITAHL